MRLLNIKAAFFVFLLVAEAFLTKTKEMPIAFGTSYDGMAK